MKTPLNRRQTLAGLTASWLVIASQRAQAATTGAMPQDIAKLGAPDRDLENKIAILIQSLSPAKVGFAAIDLVRGRTAFVREGELFPMQSVYKLPIAVGYLRMVEQDRASLNTLVQLSANDIAPGRSPLSPRLKIKPIKFTARQLIEHMLLNSDNTATDALLKLGGGPHKYQLELSTLDQLDGLRIDRYERELQPQAIGLEPNSTYADASAFDSAIKALSPEKQRQAIEKFMRDPRDAASPRALASLYFKLMSGQLLGLQHTNFILDLMRRTKTGADRLNAGMQQGWTLAHRGGQSKTVQGITAVFNDTGLATSKNGDQIALALLIKGATKPPQDLARFNQLIASTVLQAWAPKGHPEPKS